MLHEVGEIGSPSPDTKPPSANGYLLPFYIVVFLCVWQVEGFESTTTTAKNISYYLLVFPGFVFLFPR
jgi:hypothetical protein